MNDQLIKDKIQPMNSAKKVARYRLLVDCIQEYAIVFLDNGGFVDSWNAAAKKYNGYDEREIIGHHFSEFFNEEDISQGKPDQLLRATIKSGKVEDEAWHIRKDGSRFWAYDVITALYDDETGQLQGFAIVTHDITDRKATEDKLSAANYELRQQQKILTMLNEAKDEFISLASHQLRTPATGVKQYLNLILEGFLGEVPANIENALNKANDSNERQIELVNDLLQVAQLDAGKIILNREKVDIQLLIKDVLAEQNENFYAREQDVNLEVTKSTETIAYIDAHRLRMVFENIVDNASKYTAKKGRIDIKIYNHENMIFISVKDNGVGIKSADMPLLFTKFSRIQNELSDKVGGSGLGLYWANRVVELHGGRIEVYSEYQKGSEFKLIIPKG